MSRTTSTNNVRPIAPEVKRDAYGSYLPGDRSPAMARAIAADIRRRALTEPGYLDHYKADAASELPTVAQSTSRHAAGRASHALQAASACATTQEITAAHTSLATSHINAVWQVDASVCVLYRAPGGELRLIGKPAAGAA